MEAVLGRDGKREMTTAESPASDVQKSRPSPGKKALFQLLKTWPSTFCLMTIQDGGLILEAAQGLMTLSPSGDKSGATHSIQAVGTFGAQAQCRV